MKFKPVFFLTIGYVAAMTIIANNVYAESTSTGYQRKSTVAAQLPTYYPSHFQSLGVLTEIRGTHDWAINGTTIKISPNVIVHSLVTNFSSLYSIKQGMELAYKVNGQGEVAEVWQLPNGAIKRN